MMFDFSYQEFMVKEIIATPVLVPDRDIVWYDYSDSSIHSIPIYPRPTVVVSSKLFAMPLFMP